QTDRGKIRRLEAAPARPAPRQFRDRGSGGSHGDLLCSVFHSPGQPAGVASTIPILLKRLGVRRLAARAKQLGRRVLAEVAGIVRPETMLAWHRKLISREYDGTARRGPGRPRTAGEIEALVGSNGGRESGLGLPADLL